MYLCSKSVSVPFVSSVRTSWAGWGGESGVCGSPSGCCASLVTAELRTDPSHGNALPLPLQLSLDVVPGRQSLQGHSMARGHTCFCRNLQHAGC